MRRSWLVCGLLLAAASWAGAETEPKSTPQRGAERAADRLGLSVARNVPMTISADALEARRDGDGRERVTFEDRVHVEQGDLRLDCDWLEAVYAGETKGRPEELTARGNVRIQQTGTEILCSQAVFKDAQCLAVCTHEEGKATLRRGDSVIRGEEITFDLCSGVLKVRKGEVQVRPENEEAAAPRTPPSKAEP